MKSSHVTSVACLLILLFGTGCASVYVRTNSYDSHGVYPGVRADVEGLTSGSCPGSPFVIPFCTIDLPLSAAVDTLCIPFDLTAAAQKRSQFEKQSITLVISDVTVTNVITLHAQTNKPVRITVRLQGFLEGRAALQRSLDSHEWLGPGTVDYIFVRGCSYTDYTFTYAPSGVSTGHLKLQYTFR